MKMDRWLGPCYHASRAISSSPLSFPLFSFESFSKDLQAMPAFDTLFELLMF